MKTTTPENNEVDSVIAEILSHGPTYEEAAETRKREYRWLKEITRLQDALGEMNRNHVLIRLQSSK
jgi:hypothetical protein